MINLTAASTTQGAPPAWVLYSIVGGIAGLISLVVIIAITRKVMRQKAWVSACSENGF